jgi:hypothetical protein
MKYLPTENITFKSKLKTEEIDQRLSQLISGSARKYEGEINGLDFEIKRIIDYRNSFLPRIKGVSVRDFDGATIKVKMRLHISVIVFICIWCSGVGFGLIFVLAQIIIHQTFSAVVFGPLAMLVFMYVMTMGAFKNESKRSKKDLQTLFEAEIIDS